MLIGTLGLSTAVADTVPVPKPAPFAKSGASGATSLPGPALAGNGVVAAANGPPKPPAAVGAPSPPVPTPVAPPAPTPVLPTNKPPAWTVAGPGGTMALDANQRSLVERASGYLTSVQTVVGDFVQVAPDGSRSEGKFYLQKPGRVRFEYDPPNSVELIADGESVAVRDRKLLTQELYPVSQTPLRFLLADRVDLLKDTDLIGVYADELFVSLLLEERHVFGGTHRVMLMFGAQDLRLRQWTITDPQGYDTTVAIYNLDVNNKRQLNPELFKINFQRMLP
jgi:outer membrane lipoprotein-sorting protein